MQLTMNHAVTTVERIIDYTFTDPNILWEALQAPGSGVLLTGKRPISSDGHKRLALKGDAWLKLVIIEDWYGRNLPRGTILIPNPYPSRTFHPISRDVD